MEVGVNLSTRWHGEASSNGVHSFTRFMFADVTNTVKPCRPPRLLLLKQKTSGECILQLKLTGILNKLLYYTSQNKIYDKHLIGQLIKSCSFIQFKFIHSELLKQIKCMHFWKRFEHCSESYMLCNFQNIIKSFAPIWSYLYLIWFQ